MPHAERASGEALIAAALSPECVTGDLAGHILPLKGWNGSNIFIMRRRMGGQVIQVIDGFRSMLIVQVARADENGLIPSAAIPSERAKALAAEWLGPDLQPSEDFHTVVNPHPLASQFGEAPCVAVWTTVASYNEARRAQSRKTDEATPMLILDTVTAYLNGESARFEIMKILQYSPIAFPAPYTFEEKAEPSHQ